MYTMNIELKFSTSHKEILNDKELSSSDCRASMRDEP